MAKKQTDDAAETAATETETTQAAEQTGTPADTETETTTPEASGETALDSTAGTESSSAETTDVKTATASTATAAAPLTDVDTLIAARHLPRWMGESIKVFSGWKSGKSVTVEEFNQALDGWNKRSQGAGRRA